MDTVNEKESKIAVFARWFVAIMLLVYGFAKVNGSQFTVLDSELDKPMGTVSGFWLTWYYFGYSTSYKLLIAMSEIGGALLLTSRRTKVLGALLLIPVLGNIIVIDWFYRISIGAMLNAVLYLLVAWSILQPHARRLIEAALLPQSRPEARWLWAVRAAVLALVFGFTYYIANYNNRQPTVIDGVWRAEANAAGIEKVFFERNLANMVVFKNAAGQYAMHYFEMAPDSSVRIWRDYRSKGPLLYSGRAGSGQLTLAAVDSAAGAFDSPAFTMTLVRTTDTTQAMPQSSMSRRLLPGSNARERANMLAAEYAKRIPPATFLRRGVCPGECCVYGLWKADSTVVVYETRRAGYVRGGSTIPKGETFRADSGMVEIKGMSLIAVTDSIGDRPLWEWAPGDTLVLLEYLGEGHYNVWHGGEVSETGPFWGEADSHGQQIGEYAAEWWVHITTPPEGGPRKRTGWIRGDQARVSGSDACSGR